MNVQLDSMHLWLELYRFSAPTRLTEVLVHSSKLLAKTAKNDFDLNVVSVVSVKSQPDIWCWRQACCPFSVDKMKSPPGRVILEGSPVRPESEYEILKGEADQGGVWRRTDFPMEGMTLK